MYFAAYILLFLAFLASLGSAAWIGLVLYQGASASEAGHAARLAGRLNAGQGVAYLLVSGVLLGALVRYDFSLTYVFAYTDRLLPLFYRVTAFWGGQEGSLLFWAVSVVAFGLVFQVTARFRNLSAETRLWYWLFYYLTMAFFGLLLITWSNPFTVFEGLPADGRGLNPMLQNPGMIFHPPLLFLGYAGFAIPSCLALAQALSRRWDAEQSWSGAARPLTLLAWVFLSAGILLGCWWSYMELGWGGYWAWDPVENSSLIPWILGTAALHTLILQDRRHKLQRTSILLMGLTTASAFFATWLVRSGVLKDFSLHSFSDGGVGVPLLVFVTLFTLASLWCAARADRPNAGRVSEPGSREGFIVLLVWALATLAVIILGATLWPVFSAPFGPAEGLRADFYNRVCLPLFTLITVLLFACPWLKWTPGVRDVRRLGLCLGVFAATTCAFLGMGYTRIVPAISMGASLALLATCLFQFTDRRLYRDLPGLGAWGAHLGLACIVLGVAFSGPYKLEREIVLTPGNGTTVGPFTVTLEDLEDGDAPAYGYVRAVLRVDRRGSPAGVALPERRYYHKWQQNFAEVDTIFSLGNEFYASLLAVDPAGRATLRLSANPLVNWIWIGSALLCLFPLCGLRGRAPRTGDHAAL